MTQPNPFGPLFAQVKIPPRDVAPAPTPNLEADTLAQARQEFRSQLPRGVKCPCCDRFAKMYRRKLNSGMALTLMWIAHHSESNRGDASEYPWVDVPAHAPRKVCTKSRDFTILRYWKLIERSTVQGADREIKKHPGLWRPTQKGFDFCAGKLRVHSHVLVYNDAPQGFDGEMITIQEALGERFSYRELIAEWGAK